MSRLQWSRRPTVIGHRTRCIIYVTLSLLLLGCGTSEDTAATTAAEAPTSAPPSTTTTTTTAATETTPGPEATAPGTSAEVVRVDFNGAECTVSHTEAPAGDVGFVLADESELVGATLLVVELLDGHTFDEVVALQTEPLTVIEWPEGWVRLASRTFGSIGVELADNEQAHLFALQPGAFMVFVDVTLPYGYFFCAPLEVGDA